LNAPFKLQVWHRPGLPDVIFSYQNSPFWYIFEGLEMNNFDIVFDHFVHFVVIWLIFKAIMDIFFSILVYCTKEKLATLAQTTKKWFRGHFKRRLFISALAGPKNPQSTHCKKVFF
jgi:hypothetical protein